MTTDPTPALPMDPEVRSKLSDLEDAVERTVVGSWFSYDTKQTRRAALWAAVVAYGDRRAEEARGRGNVRRREPFGDVPDGVVWGDESPAPEGVERGE